MPKLNKQRHKDATTEDTRFYHPAGDQTAFDQCSVLQRGRVATNDRLEFQNENFHDFVAVKDGRK